MVDDEDRDCNYKDGGRLAAGLENVRDRRERMNGRMRDERRTEDKERVKDPE